MSSSDNPSVLSPLDPCNAASMLEPDATSTDIDTDEQKGLVVHDLPEDIGIESEASDEVFQTSDGQKSDCKQDDDDPDDDTDPPVAALIVRPPQDDGGAAAIAIKLGAAGQNYSEEEVRLVLGMSDAIRRAETFEADLDDALFEIGRLAHALVEDHGWTLKRIGKAVNRSESRISQLRNTFVAFPDVASRAGMNFSVCDQARQAYKQLPKAEKEKRSPTALLKTITELGLTTSRKVSAHVHKTALKEAKEAARIKYQEEVCMSSNSPFETTPSEPKLTLNRKEAAALLGIGVKLLWSKTKANRIPHIRIGGRVLYVREVLERWLEDQATRSVK
jgi:excisionase family DNA binding protein